jgi:hypothetical protein
VRADDICLVQLRVVRDPQRIIADRYFPAIGPQAKENARLIAAAPELADALAGALRWIGSLDDWSGAGAGDPDLDTWQAALAKARGED